MTDKEMIEEMAKDIENAGKVATDWLMQETQKMLKEKGRFKSTEHTKTLVEISAEELYNAGYRKIPEGSVVLSEGEYEELKGRAEEVFNEMTERMKAEIKIERKMGNRKVEQARKETARDILKFVDKKLDLYQNGVIGGSLYDDGYKSAVQEIKFSIKKQFGVEVEE